MSTRQKYRLTDEEFRELVAACQPNPYLVFGGMEPESPAMAANRIWTKVAERVGCLFDTIDGADTDDQKDFTAEPKPGQEVPTAAPFDSTENTKAHIAKVAYHLGTFAGELYKRAEVHDASKLQEPEKSGFDACIPKLENLMYGSDEYRAALREIKPTLEHHYAHNSHHPEFYGDNGIAGMDMADLVEMLCDWKAASERMKGGGDIAKSIAINQERFHIPWTLSSIMMNHAMKAGWIKEDQRDLLNPTIDFINEFYCHAEIAHENAENKGFWSEEYTPERMFDLVQDEIREAKEGLAAGNPPDKHCPDFNSVEVEMADVIIYIMNMARHYKWRVAEALVAKMAYNLSRPYKHGKSSPTS
jgi:NTP pyrophosphatase (non-canonical NTP hydrolase)